MSNPFKHDGEMLPVASINSVFVDDIKAYNLFRPSLIHEDIIKNQVELGQIELSKFESLSALFQELLLHDLDSVQAKANEIAYKYGYRLAKVISTLFNPSLKSISNRKDWDDQHWEFWKSIRRLYLVGGVTSPLLTKIFYKCIEDEFHKQGITGKTISFFVASQNLGTKGMTTLIDEGEYLLFDFGQTSIKRAHHEKRDGKTIIDLVLPAVTSDYLFYKTSSDKEIKQTALALDNYIVNVIENTANETNFKGHTILLAIANYVSKGQIYSARGGYGKLARIANNYQIHLEQRVTNRLGRNISVRLFHDTSSMALLFADEDHTAVISLGTAFGVAFPEKT
jgi:hypothetical protein